MLLTGVVRAFQVLSIPGVLLFGGTAGAQLAIQSVSRPSAASD